jgi:hypothetical protein
MKKIFALVIASTFAVASFAGNTGDEKKDKSKCDNKSACCKNAKADASKEKKCCKGDAAKCADKKAEVAPKAEEKK